MNEFIKITEHNGRRVVNARFFTMNLKSMACYRVLSRIENINILLKRFKY